MLNALRSQLRRLLPAPRPTSTAATATASDSVIRMSHDERVRLRLMRRDLFRLLEQHADSRRLMRHLALVERTLRRRGLAAVEALPRDVIAKALFQLESLVRDWSSDGLADTRSRLAVMLRYPSEGGHSRDHGGISEGLETAGHDGLLTSDDAQASDTDHAAFAEMERSWAGRASADDAAQARRRAV